MDTSEQYIAMCKAATQIQNRCPFAEGDFLVNQSAVGGPWLFTNYKWQPDPHDAKWEMRTAGLGRKPNWLVWLPRIDQLAGMVCAPDQSAKNLMDVFGRWCAELPNTVETAWMPMEQLWLRFVMGSCYGQRWDGEKWIGGKAKAITENDTANNKPLAPCLHQWLPWRYQRNYFGGYGVMGQPPEWSIMQLTHIYCPVCQAVRVLPTVHEGHPIV